MDHQLVMGALIISNATMLKNNMQEIDLRSDTVTKPTKGMLEAMMSAGVGDDVYKEDPSINLLEEKLAKMFNMDEALFFPSGTMANQAAIKIHTNPGEQLICDHWAHVFNFEAGGASFNSGVSCKLIQGTRGMITAKEVEENINPPDFYHSPKTSLVCLENTTNKGGGACYDMQEMKKIRQVCDKHGLGLHLDGARLFNALVAKGEYPEQYGDLFDTISICLSKGLGAPMGSVLLGKHRYMKHALRVRKVLGGAMRQVGFAAAAGTYALEQHIDRLKLDHQRAQEIGLQLEKIEGIRAVEPIQTNIVICYLHDSFSETSIIERLQSQNIRISTMGRGVLRMVTHLDYSSEMHERFLGVLNSMSIN